MSLSALRTRIESTAPRRPWCAEAKNCAQVRPLSAALDRPYIQLNPHIAAVWLQFDIDYSGAAHAWEDQNLPPPTFVAVNRANGHAQYGYALAAPVCTSSAARAKPLLFLAAIEHAYNKRLQADLAFNGPLAKNPLSPAWLLWQPANDAVYELSELAEHVDLPSIAQVRAKKRNTDYAGLGRNCGLFEQLRTLSYSDVRRFWCPEGYDAFFEHILRIAEVFNGAFPVPLGFAEVRSIARSVAKWVWKNFSPADFRELQAARGKRVGAKKRADLLAEVQQLASQGESYRSIARTLSIDHKTVSAWLRREG